MPVLLLLLLLLSPDVYLDTSSALLVGLLLVGLLLLLLLCQDDPAGLLGQLAEELRLQLRHVQALLDGVGRQQHVVVDAGRVQDHRGEQLQGLEEEK